MFVFLMQVTSCDNTGVIISGGNLPNQRSNDSILIKVGNKFLLKKRMDLNSDYLYIA